MNNIFKVIFSQSQQKLVVVSELAKGKVKSQSNGKKSISSSSSDSKSKYHFKLKPSMLAILLGSILSTPLTATTVFATGLNNGESNLESKTDSKSDSKNKDQIKNKKDKKNANQEEEELNLAIQKALKVNSRSMPISQPLQALALRSNDEYRDFEYEEKSDRTKAMIDTTQSFEAGGNSNQKWAVGGITAVVSGTWENTSDPTKKNISFARAQGKGNTAIGPNSIATTPWVLARKMREIGNHNLTQPDVLLLAFQIAEARNIDITKEANRFAMPYKPLRNEGNTDANWQALLEALNPDNKYHDDDEHAPYERKVLNDRGEVINWIDPTRESTSLGLNAAATGVVAATALGANSTATANQSVALGSRIRASGAQSTAIGNDSVTTGVSSLAIGSDDISKISGAADGFDEKLAVARILSGFVDVSSLDDSFGSTPEERLNNFREKVKGATISGRTITSTAGENLTDLIKSKNISFLGGMSGNKFFYKYIGENGNLRIYSPTAALGTGAIAMGSRAVAAKKGSTSIGTLSFALAEKATTLGLETFVDEVATGGTAIGQESRTFAENGLAVGNHSESAAMYSTAFGNNAHAIGEGALSIGDNTIANGVVTNKQAFIDAINNIRQSNRNGISDEAKNLVFETEKDPTVYLHMGAIKIKKSKNEGDHGIAMGHTVLADANQAIGIGDTTYVGGERSMAIGSTSLITEDATDSIALGTNTYVEKESSIAIGNRAHTSGVNSLAIGLGAISDLDNSTALGVNSRTDYTKENMAEPAYAPIGAFVLPSNKNIGVISVGSRGLERRIVNLAAGALDTDAVNVSQLRAVVDRYEDQGAGNLNGVRYTSVNYNGSINANGVQELVQQIGKYKRYLDLRRQQIILRARTASGESLNSLQVKEIDDKVNEFIAENGQLANKATALNAEFTNITASTHYNNQQLKEKIKAIDAAYDASGKLIENHGLNTTESIYTTGEIKKIVDSNIYNDQALAKNSIAIGYKAHVDDAENLAGNISIGSLSSVTVKDAEEFTKNGKYFEPSTMTRAVVENDPTWKPNDGAMSIGYKDKDDTEHTRRILHLAAGLNDTDAVNVAQLKIAVDKFGIHYFSVNSVGGGNEDNKGAKAQGSIAIGKDAQSISYGSMALGTGAGVSNGSGITDGFGTAIGYGAQSTGPSVALGAFAKADPHKALGPEELTYGQIAIGAGSTTGVNKGNGGIVIGSMAQGYRNNSVALGNSAVGAGEGALSAGNHAVVISNQAVGLGNEAFSMGESAVAVGNSAKAINGSNIAIGKGAQAGAFAESKRAKFEENLTKRQGDVATKQAEYNKIKTAYDAASGADKEINGNELALANIELNRAKMEVEIAEKQIAALGEEAGRTVAIGEGAKALHEDALALGAESETSAAVGTSNHTENGITYGTFAGNNPSSVVSFGKAGKERQLINVAAGRISETSTDAINGSQLYATNKVIGNIANSMKTGVLGGTASYDDKGNFTMTNIGGTGKDTIEEAIKFAKQDLRLIANPAGGNYSVSEEGKVTLKVKDARKQDAVAQDVVIEGVASKDFVGKQGLKFKGDTGNVITKTLGSELEILGGATVEVTDNNIAVKEQDGKLRVKLAKNLAGLGEISLGTTGDQTIINKDGITIKNNNKSDVQLGDSGLNNGGNTITNVGDAVNDTDAVNLGQLKAKSFGVQVTKDGVTAVATRNLNSNLDVVDDGVAKVSIVDHKNEKALQVAVDRQELIKRIYGGGDHKKDQDTVTAIEQRTDIRYKANGQSGEGDIKKTTLYKGFDFHQTNDETKVTIGDGGVVTIGLADSAKKKLEGALQGITSDDKSVTLTDKTGKIVDLAVNVDGKTIQKVKDGEHKGELYVDTTGTISNDDNGDKIVTGKTIFNEVRVPVKTDGTKYNAIAAGNTTSQNLVALDKSIGTTSETLTNKGLKFGANIGDVNPVTNKLGSTIKIKGKDNGQEDKFSTENILTKVTKSGEDTTIDIMLAKELSLDKIVVGKDGVDGKPGSIGINGKNGANADITVINGKPGVDDKDGITRIVYDNKQVATLEDGLKFAGDNKASKNIKKKLNEELEIVGGAVSTDLTENNIGVNAIDGKMKVQLSKNLSGLENITLGTDGDKTVINKDGVTITNGGDTLSFTEEGLNNGGKTITNVGNAVNDSDAATLGQVKNRTFGLKITEGTTPKEAIRKLDSTLEVLSDDNIKLTMEGSGKENNKLKVSVDTAKLVENITNNGDLVNKLEAATKISYKTDGIDSTKKEVSLEKGLDFHKVDGETIVTAKDNGVVEIGLDQTLKNKINGAVQSVTSSDKTVKVTGTDDIDLVVNIDGSTIKKVPAGQTNEGQLSVDAKQVANNIFNNGDVIKNTNIDNSVYEKFEKGMKLSYGVNSGSAQKVALSTGLRFKSSSGINISDGGNGVISFALNDSAIQKSRESVVAATDQEYITVSPSSTNPKDDNRKFTVGLDLSKLEASLDGRYIQEWTAQVGGTNVSKIGNEGKVNYAAGTNMEILTDGSAENAAKLTFKTKDNVSFTSVTTGNTVMNDKGITINNAEAGKVISLTSDNISMGGQQIHNVSKGSGDFDAVNVKQLNDKFDEISNTIGGLSLELHSDHPVMYTDDTGEVLVPVKDEGVTKFYHSGDVASDGTVTTANKDKNVLNEKIQTRIINPEGGTTGGVIFGNVASSLEKSAGTGVTSSKGKVEYLLTGGVTPTDAANLGDLKTLAEAGLDFTGNDENSVHRNLGQKLTLKGEGLDKDATTSFVSAAGNIAVVKDAVKDELLVKLSKNLTNMDSISHKDGAKITLGDTFVKIGDKDGNPVKLTNVKAGTDKNDAVNKQQLDDLTIAYKGNADTKSKTVKLTDGFTFKNGSYTESEVKEDGLVTFNVVANGNIASADDGLVTAKKVHAETRVPSQDGKGNPVTYNTITGGASAADNIVALDTAMKNKITASDISDIEATGLAKIVGTNKNVATGEVTINVDEAAVKAVAQGAFKGSDNILLDTTTEAGTTIVKTKDAVAFKDSVTVGGTGSQSILNGTGLTVGETSIATGLGSFKDVKIGQQTGLAMKDKDGDIAKTATGNFVTGLTNTAWDLKNPEYVSGRAATEDQLKKVSDSISKDLASKSDWRLIQNPETASGGKYQVSNDGKVTLKVQNQTTTTEMQDVVIEGIAKSDLSNITEDAKTVIKKEAQGALAGSKNIELEKNTTTGVTTVKTKEAVSFDTSVTVGAGEKQTVISGTDGTITLGSATGDQTKISAGSAIFGGATIGKNADGNSYVTGLSNTEWTGTAVSGRAATEDQLQKAVQSINTSIGSKNDWSLVEANTTDHKYAVDTNGEVTLHVKDANGKDATVKDVVIKDIASKDALEKLDDFAVKYEKNSDNTKNPNKVRLDGVDGTTLSNVKSSISSVTIDGKPDATFLDKLAVAKGHENTKMDAVNVSDLGNLVEGITEKGLKFGANIANGKNPVTNKLASTVEILGSKKAGLQEEDFSTDNILTKVSQDTGTGKTTIDIMLKKDLALNKVSVGEKGENGKPGVDGMIGINGKDGSVAEISVIQGKPELTKAETIPVVPMTRLQYKDAEGTPHQVATMDDGLIFKGDTKTRLHKKLNERVDMIGGASRTKLTEKNIGVIIEKKEDPADHKMKDVIAIKLARNIKGMEGANFDTVVKLVDGKDVAVVEEGHKTSLNRDGIIIQHPGKDNISLTKDGLDNGNRKIVNVAIGEDDTDAVNVSQLKGATFGVMADGKKATRKVNNTLSVVDDGNIKVSIDGTEEGTASLKIALEDGLTIGGKDGKDGTIGVNGKNGKDGVTITAIGKDGKDGADGHIIIKHEGIDGAPGKDGKDATADISVERGQDGLDGKNGENGTTRIVYVDENNEKQEVATMNDGLKFKGDDDTIIKKKLNQQLDIIGGADKTKLSDKNIAVVSENVLDEGGNVIDTKLHVKLAKDLDLGEEGSLTIAGNKYIDKTGIHAGNKAITNVKSSIADQFPGQTDKKFSEKLTEAMKQHSKDAVNVSDLQSISSELAGDIKTVNDNLTKNYYNKTEVDAKTFGVEVTQDGTTKKATRTLGNTLEVLGEGAVKVSIDGDEEGKAKLKIALDHDSIASGTKITYKANKKTDKKYSVSLENGFDFTNGTNTTAVVEDAGIVKFNVNENLTGISSISNGTDGKGASITLGKEDKDIAVNGGKLTGLAEGEISERSTDAVTGKQLHTVKNEITSLENKALTFVGDHGEVSKKLGDTLSIKGGVKQRVITNPDGTTTELSVKDQLTDGNIGIMSEEGELRVKLAKDLAVDSVTTGDTLMDSNGLTIHNVGDKTKTIVINKNNISFGGNVIHNIGDGVDAGDAVNKGQLDAAINTVATEAGKHSTVTGVGNIKVENKAQAGEAANYEVSLKDSITLGTDASKQIAMDGTTGKLSVGDKTSIENGKATFGDIHIGTTNDKGGIVSEISGLANTKYDTTTGVGNRAGIAATEGQLRNIVDDISNVKTEASKKSVEVVKASAEAEKLGLTVEETTKPKSDVNKEYTVNLDREKLANNLINVEGKDGIKVEHTAATKDKPKTFTISCENCGDSEFERVEGQENIIRAKGNDIPQRITNVAPGIISPVSTDVVNGSQLYDLKTDVNMKLNNITNAIKAHRKEANAGSAAAMAAAHLPQVYTAGDSMISAAVGTYRDQQAISVGYSRASDNGKWIIKGSVTHDSQKNFSTGFGVGYKF